MIRRIDVIGASPAPLPTAEVYVLIFTVDERARNADRRGIVEIQRRLLAERRAADKTQNSDEDQVSACQIFCAPRRSGLRCEVSVIRSFVFSQRTD